MSYNCASCVIEANAWGSIFVMKFVARSLSMMSLILFLVESYN